MNYMDMLRSIRDELRKINKALETIIQLLMDRKQ